MTTYLLHLQLPGHDTRPLTITGDTPDQLAAAVHRHARGTLGSSRVDVLLDGDSGTITNHGAIVGTFSLTATPHNGQIDDTCEADGIRYGWTLRDLDQFARAVVSNNRTWWPAGDRDDLYAAAWHGIVEHLYTADTEPRRSGLMEAGRRALAGDVRDTMRHHGARRDSSNNGAKFSLYWSWYSRTVHNHDTEVVERVALTEILATLTPGQRRALEVLAAGETYERAAQLFGTSPAGLKSQLMKGRRRFRELWHEGETPSAHWGCDRRAGTTADAVGNGSAIARIRRRTRTRAQAGEAA
ncbi:RNA polymerase sigma factor [Streptomyces sp. NPDC054933]